MARRSQNQNILTIFNHLLLNLRLALGPIFKRRLKEVPVTESTKTAVLECEVVAKPKTQIIWSHFESAITEDDKYKVGIL